MLAIQIEDLVLSILLRKKMRASRCLRLDISFYQIMFCLTSRIPKDYEHMVKRGVRKKNYENN